MTTEQRTLAHKARGTTVSLLFLLGICPAARACPMCKDGATIDAAPTTAPTTAPTDPPSAGLDLNTSIYAMLGVLTVVGTAAGRAMVKAARG